MNPINLLNDDLGILGNRLLNEAVEFNSLQLFTFLWTFLSDHYLLTCSREVIALKENIWFLPFEKMYSDTYYKIVFSVEYETSLAKYKEFVVFEVDMIKWLSKLLIRRCQVIPLLLKITMSNCIKCCSFQMLMCGESGASNDVIATGTGCEDRVTSYTIYDTFNIK